MFLNLLICAFVLYTIHCRRRLGHSLLLLLLLSSPYEETDGADDEQGSAHTADADSCNLCGSQLAIIICNIDLSI